MPPLCEFYQHETAEASFNFTKRLDGWREGRKEGEEDDLGNDRRSAEAH